MKIIVLLILFAASICNAATTETEIKKITSLRWELFERSEYPYLVQAIERGLTRECFALWEAGKPVEAVATCRKAVEAYPTSIRANRMLADIYAVLAKRTNDPTEKERLFKLEEQFRNTHDATIQSILLSGDGQSPNTAFKVITISEEYSLISYLGLKVIKQSIYREGDRLFDEMLVVDSSTVETKIYFDVTVFMKKSNVGF